MGTSVAIGNEDDIQALVKPLVFLVTKLYLPELSTHSSQLGAHLALWSLKSCDLDYPGFPVTYHVLRQTRVSVWEAQGGYSFQGNWTV